MKHDTSTHVDGFQPQRPSNNNCPPPNKGILNNGPPHTDDINAANSNVRVSFAVPDQDTAVNATQNNSAQLSLTDRLQNCFCFDVADGDYDE